MYGSRHHAPLTSDGVHVGVVLDIQTNRAVFYENGSRTRTAHIPSLSKSVDNAAFLLGRIEATDQTLHGSLSDVKIFSRPLDDAEMRAECQAERPYKLPLHTPTHLQMNRIHGRRTRIYADGRLVAESEHNEATRAIASQWTVGDQFAGDLSRIELYQRPLTENEIVTIARSPLIVPIVVVRANVELYPSWPRALGPIRGVHALRFDGSAAIRPSHAAFCVEAITVRAWIRRAANAFDVVKLVHEGTTIVRWSIDSSGAQSVYLEQDAYTVAGPIVNADVWTHLAIRVSKRVEFFTNGVLAFSQPIPNPIGSWTLTETVIGDGLVGGMEELVCVAGTEDDATIAHAARHVMESTPMLMMGFGFNESGEGDLILDESSRLNHGRLIGEATRCDDHSTGDRALCVQSTGQYAETSGAVYDNMELSVSTFVAWVRDERYESQDPSVYGNVVEQADAFRMYVKPEHRVGLELYDHTTSTWQIFESPSQPNLFANTEVTTTEIALLSGSRWRVTFLSAQDGGPKVQLSECVLTNDLNVYPIAVPEDARGNADPRRKAYCFDRDVTSEAEWDVGGSVDLSYESADFTPCVLLVGVGANRLKSPRRIRIDRYTGSAFAEYVEFEIPLNTLPESNTLLSYDFAFVQRVPRWLQVAATVDAYSNTVRLYTNGRLASSHSFQISDPRDVRANTNAVRMGEHFVGEIDDIKVYQGVVCSTKIYSKKELLSSNEALVTTDTWNHIAGIYDKNINRLCLYHNGMMVGCHSDYLRDFSVPGTNTSNVFIAKEDLTEEYFDGSIDDLRVYDRALDMNGVRALYEMRDDRQRAWENVELVTSFASHLVIDRLTVYEPSGAIPGESIVYRVFADVASHDLFEPPRESRECTEWCVKATGTEDTSNVYQNIPIYYAHWNQDRILTEQLAQVTVHLCADYADGSRRTMKRTILRSGTAPIVRADALRIDPCTNTVYLEGAVSALQTVNEYAVVAFERREGVVYVGSVTTVPVIMTVSNVGVWNVVSTGESIELVVGRAYDWELVFDGDGDFEIDLDGMLVFPLSTPTPRYHRLQVLSTGVFYQTFEHSSRRYAIDTVYRTTSFGTTPPMSINARGSDTVTPLRTVRFESFVQVQTAVTRNVYEEVFSNDPDTLYTFLLTNDASTTAIARIVAESWSAGRPHRIPEMQLQAAIRFDAYPSSASFVSEELLPDRSYELRAVARTAGGIVGVSPPFAYGDREVVKRALTMGRNETPTPTDAFPGLDIRCVSVGATHACAVLLSGETLFWGANDDAQFGDGVTSSIDPYIAKAPCFESVIDAACGAEYTLLLSEYGDVWGVGSNPHGVLGVGHAQPVSGWTRVPLPERIRSIRAASQQAGFLGESGTLYVTGLGFALGDAVPRHTAQSWPIARVRTFSMTTETCFVVTDQGVLHACGRRSGGQLGDGGDDAQIVQYRHVEYFLPNTPNEIRELHSSLYDTLVVTQCGEVWTVGHRSMPNANFEQRCEPNRVLRGEQSCHTDRYIRNVRTCTAYGGHAHLVTTDGEIYALGRGEDGQLGTGTTVTHWTPVRILRDFHGSSVLPTRAGHGNTSVVCFGYVQPGSVRGTRMRVENLRAIADDSGIRVSADFRLSIESSTMYRMIASTAYPVLTDDQVHMIMSDAVVKGVASPEGLMNALVPLVHCIPSAQILPGTAAPTPTVYNPPSYAKTSGTTYDSPAYIVANATAYDPPSYAIPDATVYVMLMDGTGHCVIRRTPVSREDVGDIHGGISRVRYYAQEEAVLVDVDLFSASLTCTSVIVRLHVDAPPTDSEAQDAANGLSIVEAVVSVAAGTPARVQFRLTHALQSGASIPVSEGTVYYATACVRDSGSTVAFVARPWSRADPWSRAGDPYQLDADAVPDDWTRAIQTVSVAGAHVPSDRYSNLLTEEYHVVCRDGRAVEFYDRLEGHHVRTISLGEHESASVSSTGEMLVFNEVASTVTFRDVMRDDVTITFTLDTNSGTIGVFGLQSRGRGWIENNLAVVTTKESLYVFGKGGNGWTLLQQIAVSSSATTIHDAAVVKGSALFHRDDVYSFTDGQFVLNHTLPTAPDASYDKTTYSDRYVCKYQSNGGGIHVSHFASSAWQVLAQTSDIGLGSANAGIAIYGDYLWRWDDAYHSLIRINGAALEIVRSVQGRNGLPGDIYKTSVAWGGKVETSPLRSLTSYPHDTQGEIQLASEQYKTSRVTIHEIRRPTDSRLVLEATIVTGSYSARWYAFAITNETLSGAQARAVVLAGNVAVGGMVHPRTSYRLRDATIDKVLDDVHGVVSLSSVVAGRVALYVIAEDGDERVAIADFGVFSGAPHVSLNRVRLDSFASELVLSIGGQGRDASLTDLLVDNTSVQTLAVPALRAFETEHAVPGTWANDVRHESRVRVVDASGTTSVEETEGSVVLDRWSVLGWGEASEWFRGVHDPEGLGTLTPLSLQHGQVRHVRASDRTVVVCLHNGTVYGMGANDHNQLPFRSGNPLRNAKRVPVLALLDHPNIHGLVRRVACGPNHTVFLLNDDRILGCGSDRRGQLGTGVLTSHSDPISPRAHGTGVADVDCGNDFTVWCTRDGRVYSCGHNGYGALDDRVHGAQNVISPQPWAMSIAKTVRASTDQTFVIDRNGDLWAVGLRGRYRLQSDVYSPMALPARCVGVNGTGRTENVANVVCGGNFVVILTRDGQLLAGGENAFGQCGTGDHASYDYPRRVVAPSGSASTYLDEHARIVDVGATTRTGFAVDDRGLVWTWGTTPSLLDIGERRVVSTAGGHLGEFHVFLGTPLGTPILGAHLDVPKAEFSSNHSLTITARIVPRDILPVRWHVLVTLEDSLTPENVRDARDRAQFHGTAINGEPYVLENKEIAALWGRDGSTSCSPLRVNEAYVYVYAHDGRNDGLRIASAPPSSDVILRVESVLVTDEVVLKGSLYTSAHLVDAVYVGAFHPSYDVHDRAVDTALMSHLSTLPLSQGSPILVNTTLHQAVNALGVLDTISPSIAYDYVIVANDATASALVSSSPPQHLRLSSNADWTSAPTMTTSLDLGEKRVSADGRIVAIVQGDRWHVRVGPDYARTTDGPVQDAASIVVSGNGRRVFVTHSDIYSTTLELHKIDPSGRHFYDHGTMFTWSIGSLVTRCSADHSGTHVLVVRTLPSFQKKLSVLRQKLDTFEEIYTTDVAHEIHDARLASDGRSVFLWGRSASTTWIRIDALDSSVSTYRTVYESSHGSSAVVTFSVDGRFYAVADSDTVFVYRYVEFVSGLRNYSLHSQFVATANRLQLNGDGSILLVQDTVGNVVAYGRTPSNAFVALGAPFTTFGDACVELSHDGSVLLTSERLLRSIP